MTITYVGDMRGVASFQTVNRHLLGAMRRAGADVQDNKHNGGDGPEITPVCVAFEYPPRQVNVRHPFAAVRGRCRRRLCRCSGRLIV